jgi:hypothetical protein
MAQTIEAVIPKASQFILYFIKAHKDIKKQHSCKRIVTVDT